MPFNVAYFIAQKTSQTEKSTFSSTATKVASISVAIGIGILVISFAILGGFQKTIKNKAYSLSGHIVVSRFSLNSSVELPPIPGSNDFIENYKSYNGIEHLQKIALKGGILKTDEEVQGIVLKGVDENYDWDRFKVNMIAGEAPDFSGNDDSKEVVISKKLMDLLKLSLNDTVMVFFVQDPVRFRNLIIKGVYETGLEDFDDKVVIGDLALVQNLNNWSAGQIGGYEIFIEDLENIDQIQATINDNTPAGQYADKTSDKYRQIFDWMGLIDMNVLILLVITLFVAGVNMIAPSLLLMMERTQMIGMLKALGARQSLIIRIFTIRLLKIVLKGLFFGNIFAFGFCYIQYKFKLIPLDPVNYYMSYVPIEWNWKAFVLVNLLTFVLIGIIILLPAYIISRVKPVKAIRFD
ncbi:ABC transporter permease [Mangrovivirga cuniculi]|uniref:ABC transporter permease n=1 Tax=Mangrovivirga cuniculi TaxID=2715131 RepID=A0A4D7JI80_9BACT|nr:FtsX-like permease family protein [Mangrovivirga cuniculi]QCK14693.1 ABC transporter permease [Mangrovivirga cuniculi]